MLPGCHGVCWAFPLWGWNLIVCPRNTNCKWYAFEMERCDLNGLPVALEIGFFWTRGRKQTCKGNCQMGGLLKLIPLVAHVVLLCVPKAAQSEELEKSIVLLGWFCTCVCESAVSCLRDMSQPLEMVFVESFWAEHEDRLWLLTFECAFRQSVCLDVTYFPLCLTVQSWEGNSSACGTALGSPCALTALLPSVTSLPRTRC